MKIQLTGKHKDKYFLIDLEDYFKIKSYKWIGVEIANTVYVLARINNEYKYLHRFLLNVKKGEVVDHRNGDTLDNRRINLRKADFLQNMGNRKPNKGKRYKGVTVLKSGKYQAVIGDRYIGLYTNLEDAARAYDREAKKYFGQFANLNF